MTEETRLQKHCKNLPKLILPETNSVVYGVPAAEKEQCSPRDEKLGFKRYYVYLPVDEIKKSQDERMKVQGRANVNPFQFPNSQ